MTISLPEERAVMGKTDRLGTEPISLDENEDSLRRWKEKARMRFFSQEGKFSQEDIHDLLARFVLGL